MRYLVLAVTLFILAAFALVMWLQPQWMRAPVEYSSSSGKALIGGAFEALDHNGAPITQDALRGHYSLVYFGFTHCPNICPTTLLVVANALEELGDDASKVVPYFVTVDPARDTPEVMASYVQNFYPTLVGITGSEAQIKAIADAYKVYYQVQTQEDSASGYLVDHSGFLYLMDTQGEYVTHFPHNVSQADLVGKLRDIL